MDLHHHLPAYETSALLVKLGHQRIRMGLASCHGNPQDPLLESQTGFEPACSRFADETLTIRGTATVFGVLYRIRTGVFLRHRQGHWPLC